MSTEAVRYNWNAKFDSSDRDKSNASSCLVALDEIMEAYEISMRHSSPPPPHVPHLKSRLTPSII